MLNKNLKEITGKLLEYKNKVYKRKYFMMSKIAGTNIFLNENLFNEFECYAKSLNKSDGQFPDEGAILDLYYEQKICENSCVKKARKNKSKLLKEANLYYNNNIKNAKDVIDSLLEGVKVENKKLDVKLEKILIECAAVGKSILTESYTKEKIIDLTDMFSDVEVNPEELAQISSEDSDEEEDVSSDDQSLQSNVQKIDRTTNKIIDIFGPLTGGKDPKSMSKQALASMLGFKGNGKYKPGQVGPVLTGWDKLEMSILRQMSPYGRSKGTSTVAQRKWWIVESIKLCLMLEKQANFFLGLSDQEKSRLSLSGDEKVKVGQVVSEMRPQGKSLSNSQIREITQSLQNVLAQGEFDLESQDIRESDLVSLLRRASFSRGRSITQLNAELDFMYPLHDTRPEFDKVPVQSDSDRIATQDEVENYFSQKDQETKEVYGNEVDEETGEPLYADEEQIAKIKSGQNVIVKDDLINDIISTPSLNMTTLEFNDFMKQIDKDLKRLKALSDKSKDMVNPDIFKEFKTDRSGKLLPDIEAIPDIIPAEGLTDKEKKEMSDIIIRLGQKQKITIINLDRRGEIYDELCDKAVSVDEFISYRKSYGLDNSDKPMSWEDIARASYGKFRGGQASRQFGVKTWFRGLFYSLSPESKANIYSYLAEKWYDRLKVLDLIDDKSFSRVPSKTGNPADDKAISASDLEKLSSAGRYKRSDKLNTISDSLEMVSKYTQPRYVKRYFDLDRDDSLDMSVQEKLESLSQLSSSEDEYNTLLKRLETEDPDTAAFALMDAMFNGNSGFRMFATGMLKEYYNDTIWPNVESELAYAVKQYFEKNYRGSNIGKSLMQGENSDKVKPDEGKELFNKIIYLVMQRTGIPSTGDRLPNVGDSKAAQISYFTGRADPRGDFSKAVMKFNAKGYTNKLYGKTGSTYNPLNRAPFGADDVNMLLSDMFDPSGIIGQAYTKLRNLTSVTEGDIIAWIGDYPEAKLDQAIILGMSMSDFYRKNDVDPTILEVIEGLGKDTKKALDDYKKQFKGLLLGKDFADYLDYEFGYETLDIKSKGSSNPGGKNFQ